MIDSGTNDMMPHFIYCTGCSYFSKLRNGLIEKMFLRKMQEYGIQSSVLTMLHMRRRSLITKETSNLAAEGKLKNHRDWVEYPGSLNEDLDLFIDNLQNSNEIRDEEVLSFFTPKLTKEELKLVEKKNKEHMLSYLYYLGADVDVEEMKKSDSKDKYVFSWCQRKTVHLSLESKKALSENFQAIFKQILKIICLIFLCILCILFAQVI